MVNCKKQHRNTISIYNNIIIIIQTETVGLHIQQLDKLIIGNILVFNDNTDNYTLFTLYSAFTVCKSSDWALISLFC